MTDNENPVDRLREQVHEETTTVAAHSAQEAAERSTRRWAPFLVAGCVLVSLLVSLAVAAGQHELAGRQADTAAAVTEVRSLAEAAKVSGEQANAELARRGQPQVPIPEPGQDDTSTLVAAATAQVLAALPDARPTAATLGQAVAEYVAANPSRFSPSPQQISEALAGYLAVNPPSAGPKGDDGATGEPGRPPTAQEIAAAVQAYCNPPGQPSPCRGPKGDKGDPGRGVQRAEVRDCRWYVLYTDGVEEDAGNACTTQTVTPPPTTTAPRPLLPTP